MLVAIAKDEMTYDIDWIKKKFTSGETIKYIFFWGHLNKDNAEVGNFIFSQWFHAPFTLDNIEYKTSEHWMMANKAKLFGDNETFEKIIRVDKPGEAKELGRQVRNFDQLTWDKQKYEIVRAGNIHKFSQNQKLKNYLINTGDRVLVEASPVDTIWGIGLTRDAKNIDNPHTWRGLNLLGFSLMDTRDNLRA